MYICYTRINIHINIYICCQWRVLFLPWVISIYLINSKDRICGTETIIFMNASLEYVKIQKLFYFWCFWSMKQKSYQLLTSFFNSTLTFSVSIFFKNTTLPTSENFLYTWRLLPPQAVNDHFEKAPHRFCSAATGMGCSWGCLTLFPSLHPPKGNDLKRGKFFAPAFKLCLVFTWRC